METLDAFDKRPQEELIRRHMNDVEAAPLALFHYTSTRGLLGILESKVLWATDIRFLNDAKELEYTLDLVREQIEEESASIDRALLAGWRRALVIAKETRIYVSCFSTYGDALSQWRAYARSGYAIGFETRLLSEIANRQQERTLLIPCLYDRRAHLSKVAQMISYLSATFSERLSGGASRSEMLEAFEVHFYAHTLFLATSFKHPKFSEEAEWRLILRPAGPEIGSVGRRMRDAGRWLAPYRQISLSSEPNPLALRQLVVGPTPDLELAVAGVSVAIGENNVECEEIRRSEIPFRDW